MTVHAPAPADPLPCSIEAEQALLGAILINEAAFPVVSGMLEPRHFSEDLHARIYSAVSDLVGAGKKITLISVGAELAGLQLPEGAQPIRSYLARLAAEATTIINARDYAEMIVDAWARRELIGLAAAASAAAHAPGVGRFQATLDDLEAGLIALRNDSAHSAYRENPSLSCCVDSILENIDAVHRGEARQAPTSGFIDIDKRLGGGLRHGRLIVVAGRPGMGKTIMNVAMARRTAQKGFGAAIFSLEIDREEVTARLLSNALGRTAFPIDYRDILNGSVGAEHIPRLRDLRERFAQMPIAIDATSGLRISQIEARAKQFAMRFEREGKRLDVVFIDYLGLIQVEDRYRGNRVAELGDVALGAKNMAKRLGVAVVLFAQLNRSVESRDSKKPMMSDLRDSGNIEEHADAVGLLYRPAYYDAKDPRKDRNDDEFMAAAEGRAKQLEIIWDKNRLGPTGSDFLYCDVAKSFIDNGERKW
ncbi:MAG: hypothetical protein N2444_00080 [Methylocystis sp.]|nr:hypothetical protein [Methylocystis sp.]